MSSELDALKEIATEQWAIEPYTSHQVPMYILFGPHRILRNVNMEEDEMIAVTALPDLLALALEVSRTDDNPQLVALAKAALQKATTPVHGGRPDA